MSAFGASACIGQERVLTWWSGSDGPDDPAGDGQNGFGGSTAPASTPVLAFGVLLAGWARFEGWEIRYEESDAGDRGVPDVECLRRSWRMHCRPCGDHRSVRNVDGSSAEAEFSGLCLGRYSEIQGLVRSRAPLQPATRRIFDVADLLRDHFVVHPDGHLRQHIATPTSLDLDRELV